MKRVILILISSVMAASANSSDWITVEVDKKNNVYTINSTKIKKIKTILPSTSVIISGWIKTDFFNTYDGIASELGEYYIKCKDGQYLQNSYHSYNIDGEVVQSKINLIRNVDLALFQPILPDSSGEVWFSEICRFSGIK